MAATRTSKSKSASKKSASKSRSESPRTGRRQQLVHIRQKPAKDADTLCGGSHSELWNRDGDRPLKTVSPQQASQGTCGRCVRVARSEKWDLL
jgi:hypothetical protein